MLNKILVVDDSPLMHRMYDIIFMRYKGAEVVHAHNGQEALELLQQHSEADLIILDINMPIMNGLDFLANIKSQALYSHIPVVIVSTEDKESETLRGLESGASGFVRKPFHPNNLHSLLEKLFGTLPI